MTSTERIKARMVRQAVDDNVDAIHNRLPKPLRASRRRLWTLGRWGRAVGLPLLVLVALAGGTADRFAAGVEPPRAAPAPEAAPPPKPAAVPDPAGLSERFPPAVLGLAVRRVVIDAGHGGDNLGTTSASGIHEKDMTLDIAGRLRRLVAADGFDVVMTREQDAKLSLQQRVGIANERRGDIFVSIHLNSLTPASARGIETFYLGPSGAPDVEALAARENQHSGYSLADLRAFVDAIYSNARRTESKRLAERVQRALMQRLGAIEPGLTDRGVKMSPFVVLSATEMPAILAEVSCLSNAGEARRLATPEYRQAIAEALAGGIRTFAETSQEETLGKDTTSAR